MRFLDPWFLLLLGIIPVLALLMLKRSSRGALLFSSTHATSSLPKSLRQRFAFLPNALRLLSMVSIVVGLARPVLGHAERATASRGIAIEMVIDRSGSMKSAMQYQGKNESRLAVVKQVFKTFVNGNGKRLPGRPNDLIGLVTFARYADTICPLTLDHRTLDAFLKQIHLPVDPALDGTAIGDGIALAAAHLEALGTDLGGATGKRYHVQSKIIILLTDGQNNFGRMSPTQAADMAKRWGIRIYTIGIGSAARSVTINTILGPQTVPAQSSVNSAILKKIAATTGGTFQAATSGSSLETVYHTIDRLQKSRIQDLQSVRWRDIYLPFVLAALALLVAASLLEGTLLRRLP